ncbi:MAG: hypothetical protein J0I07_17725, partial [Myxococcales bacterium]|nr:hypothetical protein [Myxococcales bacterium]
MPVEIPKDLVELLTSGVSILVATRDTQRLPEAVRAFAPVIAPDRRHLAIDRQMGADAAQEIDAEERDADVDR